MSSTAQALRNKKQGSFVIKIEGDAADTTTIDASSAGTNMPEDGTATIRRIMWTVESGQITITWKGAADAVATRLSGNGGWNFTQNPPVIPNNATTPTGDVTVIKTGASDYTVIIEFGTGAMQETAAA